jgi:hypothetical protein
MKEFLGVRTRKRIYLKYSLCVEKDKVVHMTGSHIGDEGMWKYSSNHSYPRGVMSLSPQPLYTQDKGSQYTSNRKLCWPEN